jgi:hypothetical protein
MLPLLPLLSLAACVSEYRKGREDFYQGVRELSRRPDEARAYFKESDEHFQAAIAEEGLSAHRRVTATSYRVRALIETDRHNEALALSSAPLEGYSLDLAYDGDPVGLSLIRSRALDPDRAFAELLVADRMAGTVKARLYVAWEQVHALERLGTPKAKSQAVKICDQHAGKLDFDELKKRLSGN